MKYLDVTVDAEAALLREWLLPRLAQADALAYLATPGNGRQNGTTYHVRGEHGAAAYVGSANLTRGGLETNQETGVV